MPNFEWGYPEVDADWADNDLVDAYYIEGWKYENDPGPDATPNPYRHGPLQSSDEVLKWLHHEHPFEPPEQPKDSDWGTCHGGFRLLIFDRTKFYPLALAIDKKSTDALRSAFQLVPETMPVLSTAEGSQRYRFQRKGTKKAKSLQVLIQSNQILKVANFMISLSFDFETKWTTAIACIENEDSDDPYVKRIQHVLGATKMNRGLWAHPTFLPTIFARHYGDEMRESRAILRGDVTHINRRLGVSTARSFRPEGLPDDWPESLDFRWLITNTYARRVEVMQVREGCKWSCKSLKFLRDLEEEVGKEEILDWDCSHNMQKVLEYHLSVLEGTEGRFATLQEESEASTNMLFNAITQRDSIIAQRYNDIQKKIATSTKEDSISMSTFTFITAVFLPGTFICAFLSLTMIDWQPQFLTATDNGTGSGSASGTGADGDVQVTVSDASGTQISGFYWVFWVIDIPLTFIVLMGWYLWFRRAKRRWIKDNNIILDPRGERDSVEKRGKRSRSGSRSSGTISTISSSYLSPVGRRRMRRGSLSSGYYTDESGSVKGKWNGRWGLGLVRAFWYGVKAGLKGTLKKGGDDDEGGADARRSRSRSRSSSPSFVIRTRRRRRGGRSPPMSAIPGPLPMIEGGDFSKTADGVIDDRGSKETFSIRSGSRVHTLNSKDGDADAVVAIAGTAPHPAPAPAPAPAPGDGLKRRSTSTSVGLGKVTSGIDPHSHHPSHLPTHHAAAHTTKGKDPDPDPNDEEDNEGDSFGGGDIVPWNLKKPKRTATWATDEDREKEKDDFFEAKEKEVQKKKEKEKKEKDEKRGAAERRKTAEIEKKKERYERKKLEMEKSEAEYVRALEREREKEKEKGGRNAEVVGGAEREKLDVREMALSAEEDKAAAAATATVTQKHDDEGDAEPTLSPATARPLAGLRDRLANARRASLLGRDGEGGELERGDVDLEKGDIDAEKGSLRSRKSKEGSVRSGVSK